ncbi:MAG TPA: putative Ig domain-containing protein, partial [Candidatus Acidoferrum sp.]|nr:putative Ig domain-containing protein [Candidatus Acidoferrum sp.]
NVIVEDAAIMPLVVAGQETRFEIKIRNEGLIAAHGVRLNIPQDTDYIITPLVEEIGTLAAKSSMSIPVTIRHRATPAGGFKADASGAIPKAGGCGVEVHSCLPKIPLSVGYYYTCGPNNVLQQRPIDLTPICVAQEAYKCLQSILGAFAVDAVQGNLYKASCEIIDALIQCAGYELSECQKAAIQISCRTVVGGLTGGLTGAAAGLGSGLAGSLGCLCDLISRFLNWLDFDIPDVQLRGTPPSGGGWSIGFTPVFNTPGGTDGAACNSPAVARTKGLSILPAPPPPPPAPAAKTSKTTTGGVCAKVRIRLEQEAVMTRAAFLGTLEIDNDGGDSITGIQVTLDIRDYGENSVSDRFALRPPQLAGLSDVNGGGVIAAGGSGSAQYTFIPTRDAAPMAPATYHIGGTLRYIEGGQEVIVPLLSSTITVFPDARLELKYFQQRDVYSDDPFTAAVEPAEPFALGILVKNNGAGAAKNFRITSAQPTIIENEKGLLVDFKIIGTQVGTQALAPTLTANLGTIPAGGSQVAQWLFTSSLQGKFTEYTASFVHVDSLGSSNLSLIDSVEIHELIHPVRTARPGDDSLPDFLVNDDPDAANFPDRLYLSDGTIAVVHPAANPAVDAPASFNDLQVQLTAAMTGGWNYFRLPNPGPNFQLYRVMRSDGRELLVGDNVWTTDRSFPSAQAGVLREHLVHLLDFDGTGSYTLHFRFEDSVAPAVLDVVDVSPNPQTNAVAFVDVIFSEPIDLSTFDYQDVTLTLDGGSNLINNSVAVALVSNSTYRIEGLAGLTAADGNYELRILAAGILDFGGNAVTNSASQSWDKGTIAPVIVSLENVSPDPRNTPVSTLDVTFSQPVDPATFDATDLTLTRNGGANLSGTLTVTPLSTTTFRISGLLDATAGSGAYAFTIFGAGVQSIGGSPGAGVRSEEWLMDANGPTVAAVEQLTTDPRSIVVQSLDVTFSEAIDPATFNHSDITLTRNGGPNLITAAMQVTPVSATTYRISNFNSVVGNEGAYSLTVSAAAVTDLAGNAGTGVGSETWVMDTEVPAAPTNLAIVPDRGISATDGLSNTNAPAVTGNLGETNLTVRLFDVTRGTDFGEATVTGTTFSRTLDLVGAGTHRIRAYAVDAAANVSADRFFDVFVDLQSPLIAMSPVLPTPRTNAVVSIDVSSSEALNTNTFTHADLMLTRDNGTNNLVTNTVTIQLVSSNLYRVNGLAPLTEAPGNYLLTLNTANVEDHAGNSGVGVISNAWQRLGINTAPQLTSIPNQSIPERNELTFTVAANDPDVPTNVVTFSLDPGAPSGAAIDPNTGVFTWTPTEEQGPGSVSITARVKDNGVPSLSSTRTFFVTINEVNEPPALAAITNQAAYVGTLLNVLNFATDPDVPVNQLTFALGAGAPAGARIHPASGVFTWSPPPAAAGTTNQFTIIVTDNGNPPLSDAKPFTVIVGDFLDLFLGFTILQAGQTGSVPVSIAGNVGPTNVTFALQVSSARLTNLSLQSPAPETGALSLEPVGGDAYLLRIAAAPGQVLSRAQPMAHLAFTAVLNQTSAFVRLRLSDLDAQQADGELVPKTLAREGRIAVIGAAPLLEALFSTNKERTVVLYGTPGKNYAVECATNLLSPTWTLFGQGALTNQFQRFEAGPTNQTLFYRAREQ